VNDARSGRGAGVLVALAAPVHLDLQYDTGIR
jgi:hypothetical protein